MLHLSLYSSVVERQSCKLKVLGSIPSGGCYCAMRTFWLCFGGCAIASSMRQEGRETKGLRCRNSPMCTLSQNGYGDGCGQVCCHMASNSIEFKVREKCTKCVGKAIGSRCCSGRFRGLAKMRAQGVNIKKCKKTQSSGEDPHCPPLTAGLSAFSLSLSLSLSLKKGLRPSSLVSRRFVAWREPRGVKKPGRKPRWPAELRLFDRARDPAGVTNTPCGVRARDLWLIRPSL